MKFLKHIFIIFSSIISIILIGNSNILMKVSATNNVLTQEDVDNAFKDPKFSSLVKTALYGIVNDNKSDTVYQVYIGKKGYKAAIIKDNGETSYAENIQNYMVFGMNKTNSNINIIGTLIVVKYDDGTIGCNYITAPKTFASMISKTSQAAVFAFDESSKNHKDYWQTYVVDESNNCYLLNSEKTDTDLIPKVEYAKIADKNNKNVIDKNCFVPAYTLEGKPVEYLSGGAKFVDQAVSIPLY